MVFTLVVVAFTLCGTAIVGLVGYVLDRSAANHERPRVQAP
jgi:hypothetical protein